MLDKSRSFKVDCAAYDLEDSVAPAQKADARRALRQFLSQPRAPGIREVAVRINSVDSGLALGDLEEVVSSRRTLRNQLVNWPIIWFPTGLALPSGGRPRQEDIKPGD
jgi:citrate lyase beta subunit